VEPVRSPPEREYPVTGPAELPFWVTECPFPKHQGVPWPEVARTDPEYVDRVLANRGSFPMMERARTYLEALCDDDEI